MKGFIVLSVVMALLAIIEFNLGETSGKNLSVLNLKNTY